MEIDKYYPSGGALFCFVLFFETSLPAHLLILRYQEKKKCQVMLLQFQDAAVACILGKFQLQIVKIERAF